ncbi:suppressor of fused domain protein [Chloroflexia bacterium SDU3-3]|nr:suppressor of fused domain protein [Chloroflexia bacterium SDU3-3]
MAHNDPRSRVLENYVRWMGEPEEVFAPDELPPHLSPKLGVLRYPHEHFSVYCTAGASMAILPHSKEVYGDNRGVRFEYLFHGPNQQHQRICELLIMLASYPYTQHIIYDSGFIIPIGTPVAPHSNLRYLYLTYPYQDDPHIFTDTPFGQISTPDLLIQTWWAFPISHEEALFVRSHGPTAFDQQCYQRLSQQYDIYNFTRPSLLSER